MQAKELLALDIGTKRTGIARASTIARIAEPLKTVPTDELAASLEALIKAGGVRTVVVGLPRSLQGDDTQQTGWVRTQMEDIRSKLPEIEFIFQDEALTTKLAETRVGKKFTDVDAEAAAIILQDFLESEAHED